MKKPIPTFRTDREAEDFVAKADLTEYDLSGGQVVRFEMRPKNKAVSLVTGIGWNLAGAKLRGADSI